MTNELKTAKRCFRINAADNVATLLDDVDSGPVVIYGAEEAVELQAAEPIALGHKIALAEIACGSPIVKYGVPIGVSTEFIKPGEWVHLHNCRSKVDERSNHLDPKSGAAKDTPYG